MSDASRETDPGVLARAMAANVREEAGDVGPIPSLPRRGPPSLCSDALTRINKKARILDDGDGDGDYYDVVSVVETVFDNNHAVAGAKDKWGQQYLTEHGWAIYHNVQGHPFVKRRTDAPVSATGSDESTATGPHMDTASSASSVSHATSAIRSVFGTLTVNDNMAEAKTSVDGAIDAGVQRHDPFASDDDATLKTTLKTSRVEAMSVQAMSVDEKMNNLFMTGGKFGTVKTAIIILNKIKTSLTRTNATDDRLLRQVANLDRLLNGYVEHENNVIRNMANDALEEGEDDDEHIDNAAVIDAQGL